MYIHDVRPNIYFLCGKQTSSKVTQWLIVGRKRLSQYKGPIGSRSGAQLYICVKMRHNPIVLLLFLVFFRLSSVKAYKLMDDNLQEQEDPEWNQVIGNSFWDQIKSSPQKLKKKSFNHEILVSILFSDYSTEDLVKYGSGFRSLWDTNPYLDLDTRSKRVHGALRFHRPWRSL